MAFLVPRNLKSTSSGSAPSNSSHEAQAVQVTSCLYIKPSRDDGGGGSSSSSSANEGGAAASGGGKAMEKDAVLRRIRHRKRMNSIRNALQYILRAPAPAPESEDKDRDVVWMQDAFPSP